MITGATDCEPAGDFLAFGQQQLMGRQGLKGGAELRLMIKAE
jgi:hypothetical protein